MKCLTPIHVRNKDSPDIEHVVPCGSCLFCMSQKRQEWTFRIEQELKHSKSAYFITLTYSDENLSFIDFNDMKFSILVKSDLQKFIKLLRFHSKQSNIRYYAVGEYGSKSYRAHYHILIFNLLEENCILDKQQLSIIEFIERIWKKGLCHQGTITSASIKYVLKYMLKGVDFPLFSKLKFEKGKEYLPFSIMSQGIGRQYIYKAVDFHRADVENRNYFPSRAVVKPVSLVTTESECSLKMREKNKFVTQKKREKFQIVMRNSLLF